MEQPKVTIFIPTYNRADYLEETIQSVLNQTVQPVELLVLDDASSDKTPQVMASFLGDSRVRYVRHEKNVGMAANWRAGLERVRTKYFCLLNDDDLLAPDFIEKLLPPLEADPELIVAFCDHKVIDGAGAVLDELTEKFSRRHKRDQLPRGKVAGFGEATVLDRSLHVSCSLLRTKFVPLDFIDERAGGFACGYMFYQCFRTGKSASYEPERLVSYRIHSGNMLSNPEMSGYITEGQVFWCRQILRDALPESLRKKAVRQIARIFTSHAFGLISAKRIAEASSFLQESLKIRPSFKAHFGLWILSLGPKGDRLLVQLRKIVHLVSNRDACIIHAGPSLTWLLCL